MGYRTRLRRQTRTISLTPSAQSLVNEFGLDPALITGSGKGGRIVKKDVVQYLATHDASSGEEE